MTALDHPVHILVLNYNGRALLAECLGSVIASARAYPGPCRVTVVDNASADDSIAWLESAYPDVEIRRQPNRGLASFNAVAETLDQPYLLLLNNDVQLDVQAIAPLIDAMQDQPEAAFSAPLCWDRTGLVYEGMRTRVRSRFGLVQGMARVPGHLKQVHRPDLTAAAGPILMVDRKKFLDLGGYDPLFFPGRIEDLDLGFRAWMQGWPGLYVPDSVAYHIGFATFDRELGRTGSDYLAARNTLLFCWKHFSGRRLLEHLAWLPIRLSLALMLGRWTVFSATVSALVRVRHAMRQRRQQGVGQTWWNQRQDAFFERFSW